MIFITLIPTHRNDGSPVSEQELREVLARFLIFGGATMEWDVEGFWIDPVDNQTYHDKTVRVTVETGNERLPEAETLVKAIGQALGQKAMFFEVRYFDGVRILRID